MHLAFFSHLKLFIVCCREESDNETIVSVWLSTWLLLSEPHHLIMMDHLAGHLEQVLAALETHGYGSRLNIFSKMDPKYQNKTNQTILSSPSPYKKWMKILFIICATSLHCEGQDREDVGLGTRFCFWFRLGLFSSLEERIKGIYLNPHSVYKTKKTEGWKSRRLHISSNFLKHSPERASVRDPRSSTLTLTHALTSSARFFCWKDGRWQC